MHIRMKRVFMSTLIVCLIFTQVLLSGTALATTSDRLYGSDRYKTAVSISKKGWPSGSDYVVLARGDDFADALCAGPLAMKYDAPILLTEPGRLNPDILNEIRRLGAEHVFIAGGIGAVSASVESSLKLEGITDIVRLAGSDRFETSVKIAEKLGRVDKIVVATGSDFPDALSVSSVASSLGMPILLTDKNSLPGSTEQYIDSMDIDRTYIIGGTGVIGSVVENSVPSPKRLGGSDRFETNVLVLQEFEEELDFSKLFVAVGDGPGGDEFADALTGAVLAAKNGAPIVLVYRTLPGVTENYLEGIIDENVNIFALGGTAVVSNAIIDSIVKSADNDVAGEDVTYDKAGTYGPSSGKATLSGDVVIEKSGVILRNTVVKGNLLVSDKVGKGDFTLKNVTVEDTVVIEGGGENTGEFIGCDLHRVIIRVKGWPFRLVVEGGVIDAVIVDENADDTLMELSDDANIDTFEAYGPVEVTGDDYTIETAAIYSEGVSLSQMPDELYVDDDVTVEIDGDDYEGPIDGDEQLDDSEVNGISVYYYTADKPTVRRVIEDDDGEIDLSDLSDTVQVREIYFDTEHTGTVRFDGLKDGDGNSLVLLDELKDEVSLRTVDIEDLIGHYLTGNNGVSLRNLRLIFGDKATITGRVTEYGHEPIRITVVLNLGGAELYQSISGPNSQGEITGRIKSGMVNKTLNEAGGVYGILSAARCVPYEVRIDDNSSVRLDDADAAEVIKGQIGGNWNVMTMDDLASQISEGETLIRFKKTSGGAWYKLIIVK